jgi:hypothetical protein
MLTLIDSADDVIALTVSNKITDLELRTIMDRLDEVMSRHDKVHVFAEARAIDGIGLSGLPAYTTRAMPLLGKLRRFGRVAAVADQAWIRIATRLESAILPLISYRTFEPEQQVEALACVAATSGSKYSGGVP